MEQRYPLPNQDYMVNISCMTYNHENYIEDALKGFVMQKTNFPFCALVIDDASTDGTADIIRRYEKEYPDIIKGVYLTENHYSKKKSKKPYFQPWRERSKYIAMCEGDDYWTDPLKLQKQVDFLEANPEYSMCSTKCQFYYEKEGALKEIYPLHEGEDCQYTFKKYIKGHPMTQTATVLYRKEATSNYNQCKKTSDLVLYYFLLKSGNGFCLPEITSIYRVHDSGVWSGATLHKRYLWEFDMKLAIFETDKDKNAVVFLLHQFTKPIPRSLLINNVPLFIKVYKIISRYYGPLFTLKLLLNKILFNKNHN